MPATEETYRRQPTLHLVFAISSIAMLLATVWMVMADHLRPWKQVQREFQLIEREKLKASEKEKQEELNTKYKTQLDEIDAKIEAANASAEERREPDSRWSSNEISKLDAAAEDAGHAAAVQEDRARQQAQSLRRHDRSRRGAAGTSLSFDGRGADRARARATFRRSSKTAQAELKGQEGREREAAGQRRRARKGEGTAHARGRPREAGDRTERRSLRWPAALVQQPMAFLRSLPGIDLVPPTKIQQLSLPELTINYNFKEVPRYDRCQTCHQGIDRDRVREGRRRQGDARASSSRIRS